MTIYGSTTGKGAYEDDNLEVLAILPAVIWITTFWVLLAAVLAYQAYRKAVSRRAVRTFADPALRQKWLEQSRVKSGQAPLGLVEGSGRRVSSPETAEGALSILEEHRNDTHEDESDEIPAPPPFRANLTFQELRYKVDIGSALKIWNKKRLHILNGAEGWIRAGELTAIMGSSGGGKTTLMNALTGRTKGGVVSGDIRVNGVSPGPSFFQQTGFVYQFEVLTPELTVRETLSYAASLMLPPRMSEFEKFMSVESVLKEVGLSHVANNRIGSELKPGISGGQLKRVGIAIELLRNPSVLFLDEPTSGLDALTSLSLLKTLKSLARSGRAIAFTIHQPRSEIFEMFDTLILVKKGKVVYHGNKTNAITFLAGLSKRNNMQYTNLGDFVADTVCAPEGSSYGLLDKIDCHDMFTSSAHGSLLRSKIQTIHCSDEYYSKFTDMSPPKVGVLKQAIILAERMWTVYWRRLDIFLTELLRSIAVAVVIGITFWQLGNGYADSVSRAGLTFFITTYVLLSAAIGISTYHEHIKVFTREHATGMVSSTSMLLATIIVDTPRESFFTWLFTTLIYVTTAVGSGFGEYCYLVLLTIIGGMMSTSFFAPIAVLNREHAVANIIWLCLLMLMYIFGGFFIASDAIPEWLQWGHYLSFYSWLYGGLLEVVFSSRSINFVPISEPSCDLQSTYNSLCSSSQCTVFQQTCPASGTDYIKALKMEHMNRYNSLIFAVGIIIFFRVVATVLLAKITLKRKFKVKLDRKKPTPDDSTEDSREMHDAKAADGRLSTLLKVSTRKITAVSLKKIYQEKGSKPIALSGDQKERMKHAKLSDFHIPKFKILFWRMIPLVFNRTRDNAVDKILERYNNNHDQVERIINYSDGGTLWMRCLFKLQSNKQKSRNAWNILYSNKSDISTINETTAADGKKPKRARSTKKSGSTKAAIGAMICGGPDAKVDFDNTA